MGLVGLFRGGMLFIWRGGARGSRLVGVGLVMWGEVISLGFDWSRGFRRY